MTVLYTNDFDSLSGLKVTFSDSANGGANPNPFISADQAYGGSGNSIKCVLPAFVNGFPDSSNPNSFRAEVNGFKHTNNSEDVYNGQVRKFGLRYYLPSTTTPSSYGEIILQLHNHPINPAGTAEADKLKYTSPGGRHINVRNDGIYWHDTRLTGLITDQWFEVFVEVKCSTGSDGYVKVRINGTEYVTENGSNLNTPAYVSGSSTPGYTMYLKCGVYGWVRKPPKDPLNPGAYPGDSSGEFVIYVDKMAIGDSAATYADLLPGGGGTPTVTYIANNDTIAVNSKFENGTSDFAGANADASGIASISGWTTGGANQFGNSLVANIAAAYPDQYAAVTNDTTLDSGNVIECVLAAKNGTTGKNRVQFGFDMTSAPVLKFRMKMYFHPDCGLLKTYPSAYDWLTLSSVYADNTWNSTYPFVISMDLAKPDAAVPSDLKFRLRAREYSYPDYLPQSDTWEVFSSLAVPIGQWMLVEHEIIAGNASNGRYRVYVTPQGGSRTLYLDVTNFTRHPSKPSDTITAFTPIKWYTGYQQVDHVANLGGTLRMQVDDLQVLASDTDIAWPTTEGTTITIKGSGTSEGTVTDLTPTQKNGLPVCILKIDDLKNWLTTSDTADDEQTWANFFSYIESQPRLKAGLGAIGSHFSGTGATDLSFYAGVQARLATGKYEIWNHGSGSSQAVLDVYSGGTEQQQYDDIQSCQASVLQALGVIPIAVGTPSNLDNANTPNALEAHPDIKVWLYSNGSTTGTSLLRLQRYPNVFDTHNNLDSIDTANFVSTFASSHLADDYIVYQGHAGKWSASQLSNFQTAMNALLAAYPDLVFMTPSEYFDHCATVTGGTGGGTPGTGITSVNGNNQITASSIAVPYVSSGVAVAVSGSLSDGTNTETIEVLSRQDGSSGWISVGPLTSFTTPATLSINYAAPLYSSYAPRTWADNYTASLRADYNTAYGPFDAGETISSESANWKRYKQNTGETVDAGDVIDAVFWFEQGTATTAIFVLGDDTDTHRLQYTGTVGSLSVSDSDLTNGTYSIEEGVSVNFPNLRYIKVSFEVAAGLTAEPLYFGFGAFSNSADVNHHAFGIDIWKNRQLQTATKPVSIPALIPAANPTPTITSVSAQAPGETVTVVGTGLGAFVSGGVTVSGTTAAVVDWVPSADGTGATYTQPYGLPAGVGTLDIVWGPYVVYDNDAINWSDNSGGLLSLTAYAESNWVTTNGVVIGSAGVAWHRTSADLCYVFAGDLVTVFVDYILGDSGLVNFGFRNSGSLSTVSVTGTPGNLIVSRDDVGLQVGAVAESVLNGVRRIAVTFTADADGTISAGLGPYSEIESANIIGLAKRGSTTRGTDTVSHAATVNSGLVKKIKLIDNYDGAGTSRRLFITNGLGSATPYDGLIDHVVITDDDPRYTDEQTASEVLVRFAAETVVSGNLTLTQADAVEGSLNTIPANAVKWGRAWNTDGSYNSIFTIKIIEE